MLQFKMKGIMLGLFCLVFVFVKNSALPTTLNPIKGNETCNQALFLQATIDAINAGNITPTADLGYQRSAVSAPTNYDCTVRSVPAAVRRRLGLDYFYTQYAHAYGIPVVSSNRVKRSALERACYVMRFLFADRKDVRDWFYRRNGRAGIMARSEGTTTIPEHRFLPAWWNQRARGLGATIHIPISTGGEENLLCESGDRYYNEDIFLHEFVHGIHNLGATGAIPSFDSRLRAAYNSARSRGLWSNTYALSTDREYFAEGTQSFFYVNAHSAQPNGVHNSISTREKLRQYDPTLYNLIKEVFPCENNFLKRCDAKNGKVAPSFKMDCKNGGGTVVTDEPPKPSTPPVPTPPKPDTPAPPKPDTSAPPKPDTPAPPKPDTPAPPKPDTSAPPKPDTPAPPKPDTPAPPKPDTSAPPKPDTPAPPKPDTPAPPKPDTPPVPTTPKPDTPAPPKPDTPPVPTPPKPDTPAPPKPDTPAPPKPDTPAPPKPDTPPVPTPPKPDTPAPPKPDTLAPPKPETPPVPTPPKPDTPAPPKPDTPAPPKPDTPPVPTPPIPTPPAPTTPRPTTKKPPPPKPSCVDRHTSCSYWAYYGYCRSNYYYMKTTCCSSCRKVNCRDYNNYCQSWAYKGECRRNPRYMLQYCKKSCRVC